MELVTCTGSTSSTAFLFLEFDTQTEANVGSKEILSWSALIWAELLKRCVMSARGLLSILILFLFLKDWTFTGTGLVLFGGGIFSLLLWSQRAIDSIGWCCLNFQDSNNRENEGNDVNVICCEPERWWKED